MTKSKLPGDPDSKTMLAQIIRVNHAGEYGAKRIYEGQLRILKNSKSGPIIAHMKEQELKHLEYFEQQIAQHQVRPSLLQPLWHVSGYLLGVGTALLGPETAFACTEAVEDVIAEHYGAQIEALGADHPELKEKIIEFRQEEIEHQNIALEHNSTQAPAHKLLTQIIKCGCKLAIKLAKHV
jgi:ubiquinone biosynthesis monooxygenase Coq7